MIDDSTTQLFFINISGYVHYDMTNCPIVVLISLVSPNQKKVVNVLLKSCFVHNFWTLRNEIIYRFSFSCLVQPLIYPLSLFGGNGLCQVTKCII